MTEITIETEYINLGQLLKLQNLVNTGGQVKQFLQDNKILVNKERVLERGKKLYPGDIVEMEGFSIMKITK